MSQNEKIDRLQNQLKKFQSEMLEAQVELKHKFKNLENLQFVEKTDQQQHLRSIMDQLEKERALNTQLNTDLSKSLALGLQLQLEMQTYKKDLHTKLETEIQKNQQLSKDLALQQALKEETENELHKARLAIQNEQELHKKLNKELEDTTVLLAELENTTEQQQSTLRTLTEIAEKKIIELKLQLDRKDAECKDFESHLQHALTQNQMIKQENLSLKDYITKLTAIQNPQNNVTM